MKEVFCPSRSTGVRVWSDPNARDGCVKSAAEEKIEWLDSVEDSKICTTSRHVDRVMRLRSAVLCHRDELMSACE